MAVQLLSLFEVLCHLQRNLIITNTGYVCKMKYHHPPQMVILRLINNRHRTPMVLVSKHLSGNEKDGPSLHSNVLYTTGHLPDLVPIH